jgi:hypothetical protein
METDIMERNERNQVNRGRREFLVAMKGAGMLGAIAVLAGKSAAIEAAALVPGTLDQAAGSGYRETEHIRKYYSCARYW